MGTYTHINLDYLNSMSGGDKDFMVEVIEEYMEREPANFQLLVDAIDALSYPNMRYYAHKLRSAVQMVGAKELLQKLEQVELLAAEKDEKSLLIFKSIPDLNSKVLLELKQELNNLRK